MKQSYVSCLSESCYEHAERVLGETTVSRNEGLAEMIQWLQNEQPNLRIHNDVRYIVYFLRTAKYDVGKAKQKILM